MRRFETLALALLGALLAGRLLSALVELALPPLAPADCGAETPRQAPGLPFARAFGLSERPAPARPARPHPRPASPQPAPLAGYTLTMTAVGDPGSAIVMRNGKGRLLRVGERLDGLVLRRVETDRVLFEKGGRTYALAMKRPKSRPAPKAAKLPPIRKALAQKGRTAKPRPAAEPPRELVEQIQQEGDTCYLPKELVAQMSDLKTIFRYISLQPLRKKKRLEGFVVTRVAKGSVFEKMGLKPRDVIVKVNGEPFEKESDAFKYFNQLDNIRSLSLTVRRGAAEKELHYEIF